MSDVDEGLRWMSGEPPQAEAAEGVSAPSPMRTALHQFSEEFEAKVRPALAPIRRAEETIAATSESCGVRATLPALRDLPLTLLLEPGRSLVAAAGVLLTRVVQVKQNRQRTFVVVDAGMNDLLRPALYDSFHGVEPVVSTPRPITASREKPSSPSACARASLTDASRPAV